MCRVAQSFSNGRNAMAETWHALTRAQAAKLARGKPLPDRSCEMRLEGGDTEGAVIHNFHGSFFLVQHQSPYPLPGKQDLQMASGGE